MKFIFKPKGEGRSTCLPLRLTEYLGVPPSSLIVTAIVPSGLSMRCSLANMFKLKTNVNPNVKTNLVFMVFIDIFVDDLFSVCKFTHNPVNSQRNTHKKKPIVLHIIIFLLPLQLRLKKDGDNY